MNRRQGHGWGKPPSPDQRGYGTPHRRIRQQLFRDEPNCRECAKHGVVTKATHADHIVPKCLGGETVRSNYQPLCTKHSRSKAGKEGNTMRRLGPFVRAVVARVINQ